MAVRRIAGVQLWRHTTSNREGFSELRPNVLNGVDERAVHDCDRITAGGLTAGVELRPSMARQQL